jgi:hypothetical protein
MLEMIHTINMVYENSQNIGTLRKRSGFNREGKNE